MGVKDKRRESQPFSSSLGKKQRSSTLQGFQGRVTAIRGKARVNLPKVGDISKRLASQCREHVSIATSLET